MQGQAVEAGASEPATNVLNRILLTKNSTAKQGSKCDNTDSDLILYSGDCLRSGAGHNYVIVDLLGQGTFGQVVKCQKVPSASNTAGDEGMEEVAVKVVKNKPAYFNQALTEIRILKFVKERLIKGPDSVFVEMEDYFKHKDHLCLTFEILGPNLYELLKGNQFRGFPTAVVRKYVMQILSGCKALAQEKIVHCDLKPENILIVGEEENRRVKIIDLGSACFEGQTVYSYIQSRFYRSPEVLLRIGYDSAIDVWSVGCIAAELFLGLPLFPGVSEHSQLGRIIDMFETYPPDHMLRRGRATKKFFKPRKQCPPVQKRNRADQFLNNPGRPKSLLSSNERYSLKIAPPDTLFQYKTPQEYADTMSLAVDKYKTYFRYAHLDDIIMYYPMAQVNVKKERQERTCFIDLLRGLLLIDHCERWTAAQAGEHPFFSKTQLPEGGYKPSADAAIDKRRQDMCDQLKEMRLKGSAGRVVGKKTAATQKVGEGTGADVATSNKSERGRSRPVKIRKNRRHSSGDTHSGSLGTTDTTTRLPATNLTPPQKVPRVNLGDSKLKESSPSQSHLALSLKMSNLGTAGDTDNRVYLGTSLPSASSFMSAQSTYNKKVQEGQVSKRVGDKTTMEADPKTLGQMVTGGGMSNFQVSNLSGSDLFGTTPVNNSNVPPLHRRAQLAVGEIHSNFASSSNHNAVAKGQFHPDAKADGQSSGNRKAQESGISTGQNTGFKLPQSWAGVSAPWMQPPIFTPPVAGNTAFGTGAAQGDTKEKSITRKRKGNQQSLLSNLFSGEQQAISQNTANSSSAHGLLFNQYNPMISHFGSAPESSHVFQAFANRGKLASENSVQPKMLPSKLSPKIGSTSPTVQDDDGWGDDQFDLEMDNPSPVPNRPTADSVTTAANIALPEAKP